MTSLKITPIPNILGPQEVNMVIVATYPTTGMRAKSKSVSSKKKTRGSCHQCLFKENVRKTKKRHANFENKGSGVVYA